MGGRYIVSGAQLGNLIALSQMDVKKTNVELNKIIENQFVGNSDKSVKEDVKLLESEWDDIKE